VSEPARDDDRSAKPTEAAKQTEAAAPAAVASPAEAAEAAPDSNALRQLWPEVLTALKDRSRVKWAMMNEVVIASVEGEQVNLLAPAGLVRRIADESNLSVLREVLQSVVFGHWRLTISSAPPANGGPTPPPEEPPAETEPEPSPRARAARQARPAQAEPVEPPAPVINDDGVDEVSDEVHRSQRSGDAEAAAMELLQTSLGARPIDAS
jgi:DNA polymerase-3 subunit gamma/tau